jgi:hypothetical protein
MMIIGCDFHPSWQQVNWVDTETGDWGERKLVHANGEAEQFYRQLVAPVLIGMEATGNSQWFVELVEDLGHAIWIGDAGAPAFDFGRNEQQYGHPPFDLAYTTNEMGAPSSRTLRGWVARLPAAPVLTAPKSRATCSIVPALAKNARAGHPPFWNRTRRSERKGWATRQGS